MGEPILVTGGAGYIGSHAVLALQDAGFAPVVLDNFATGVRQAVPDDVALVEGDVADALLVAKAIKDHDIKAVMHFAGSVRVDESVADPLKYYRNNTAASRTLIETCLAAGVERFLFSSTAAVYGIPATRTVTEDTPKQPINPYGWSKLMTEQMLIDTVASGADAKVAALRYFNVAGADPDGRTGQRTPNATHLIKVASECATGKRPGMQIFGTDYDTPDGTCIRDYIHVSDLADAHVQVLDWLKTAPEPLTILNCGYGRGFSVREVLAAVQAVSGVPLQAEETGRRAGDPPALISDPGRLKSRLGWQPRHDNLTTIVQTAYDWERSLS